ncbi:aminotransferase class V [Azospirillum sp. TSO22-1]|nr:aminotransferase class V [Azospirillum sp. TSO22-1]
MPHAGPPAFPGGPTDEQSLTRLANELFAALPGGAAGAPPWLAPSALPTPSHSMPSHELPAGGFGAPLPDSPLPGVPSLGATLPGTAELVALLAPRLPAGPALPPAAAAGGPLYVLDGAGPPRPGAAVPPVPAATVAHPPFDAHLYRRDFPILGETVNGRPLIWLDNAATTQKPQAVIDRLAHFYAHENSNIHRAAHEMAARATDAYEAARDKVRRFLNAASPDEIVFVRGATEAINLVAKSWGPKNLREGDEIVVTWLEHHANIVPWQQLAALTGARLRVVPVDDRGQVLLEEYERLLNPRTRLVAFTQVSNALGTVTPAKAMVEMARRHGAHVLVDGAQAVSHMRVDVQDLGADWYALSGHKMFGPTGIGVLYGRKAVLDAMPPWQGGGNMIRDVTFEKTEYHGAPARFEAGTGNIADAVGLGAAVDYLDRVGMENVARHEHALLEHGTRLLREIGGLRLIGTAAEKAGVLSFVLDGMAPEEVGKALNREGIAVRSGHHCAQPILRRFGLEATVRPSLAFYNTFEDVDALAAALRRIRSGAPPPGLTTFPR